MQLVAAFDINNFGRDAGEFAHVGNLGIQISDVKDLETVLKKTQADVLIDFTAPGATADKCPSSSQVRSKPDNRNHRPDRRTKESN